MDHVKSYRVNFRKPISMFFSHLYHSIPGLTQSWPIFCNNQLYVELSIFDIWGNNFCG